MSNDFIGETMQFFKNKLDQLKPELINKKEKRGKTRKAFSELLSYPFWKKPFTPFLKGLIKRKLRRLNRKISDLEGKIEDYEHVLADLEQGIYGSAILLLERLAIVECIGNMPRLAHSGLENTKCGEMLKLIEQLKTLNS